MIFPVTLTSQGQITIPAKARRELGFDKTKNLIAKTEDNKLILEAEPDLMSLSGSLHKYALKNKTIDEIIEIEENAAGEAVAEKYRKQMKKLGIPLPKAK